MVLSLTIVIMHNDGAASISISLQCQSNLIDYIVKLKPFQTLFQMIIIVCPIVQNRMY